MRLASILALIFPFYAAAQSQASLLGTVRLRLKLIPIMWGRLLTCDGLVIRLLLCRKL